MCLHDNLSLNVSLNLQKLFQAIIIPTNWKQKTLNKVYRALFNLESNTQKKCSIQAGILTTWPTHGANIEMHF